ncbi:MAG TPA: branched-chain amino acid ABC transporter permease [Desulfomonilaceae bacterium]|nr:branched-chain amino acid ABC transporter permease [Desulfomonilaceae bacterium]HVN83105.1 branched-chain amino acid ABC transporter permease [Terriglobia bacterium]
MEQLAQQLVNGVLIGLVYALLAIGLTLVWGVMNVLNFAHGEFLMIGMFISYWLYVMAGMDPLFSIPVNAVALFLFGMFIYRFIISKVMQGPALAQLVVTFGISIFIANFAALIWTPNFRSIEHTLLSGTWDISGIKLSIPKFVTSIGSVITSFGVFWFLRNTRIGKAILAVEMDREAALIMGINTERINSLSFGIGSGLVGVAGALLATHYYIYPFVGGTFGLTCFCIVALGGFGSIEGAFIAGILVGVVQTLGGYVFDPAYKLAIVFAMYLIVVWIRPQGLKGW